jgi:hypothetical protein
MSLNFDHIAPRQAPPSGLDIPMLFTKFRDEFAKHKRQEESTLRAMVPWLRDTRATSKAALPWVKLATFGDQATGRGSLRHDDNMLSIYGVEGDYDGEQITLERARQIVAQANIAAILYTSPSHTPATPRWRILCPTSGPLPPSERAGLLARVNGLFVGALSNESWALSQSYYVGAVEPGTHHEVIALDGRPIDQAHELAATAIGKPVKPKTPTAPATPFTMPAGDGTPYGLRALESECQAIVNAPDGGKHHALNKAAYSIGGLVTAGQINEGHAAAALSAALNAIRHRCGDFDHATKTLRVAFEDGKAAPRAVPERPEGGLSSLKMFSGAAAAPPSSAGGAEAGEGDAAAPGGEEHKQSPLWLDDSDPLTVAIPRRPWCVPGYLMRGSVSLLSGQGAGGKSSLVVGITISCATGEALGAFAPVEPMVVVNYNTEDDQDEQRRRYSAALQAQGKRGEDIRKRVIRCGPHDVGTLFERDPTSGRITVTAAMAALEEIVINSGADVLICDPVAELHNAEENDNTAMRAVVAAFRSLAKRLNIAVLLLHHDRKGNNAPGDMDRVRGASAISGAVRVMLTLTTMSEQEAEKFNIPPDQRRRHFRIDGAKSNYAPAGEAEWWRLTGYEIANGETVAAALPWSPPSAFDGISMATCVAILERLQRGVNGCPFGAQGPARAELFAALEQEPFNLSKGQATAMLGAWLAQGVVSEQPGCASPNSNRKRSGFVVDPAKLSEMRREA